MAFEYRSRVLQALKTSGGCPKCCSIIRNQETQWWISKMLFNNQEPGNTSFVGRLAPASTH